MPRQTTRRPGLRPLHAQLPQRVQLLLGELVPPGTDIRYPYAQFDDHRLRLAVDRDLFSVAARNRPVGAFPLHPLREGRQAALKRLLRLARASSHA